MPTYICPQCQKTFHEEGRHNVSRIEGTGLTRKMFWECISCKKELEIPLCPYLKDGTCYDFFGCAEEFCMASSYESGDVHATRERVREYRIKLRDLMKIIMRDNFGDPIVWRD